MISIFAILVARYYSVGMPSGIDTVQTIRCVVWEYGHDLKLRLYIAVVRSTPTYR